MSVDNIEMDITNTTIHHYPPHENHHYLYYDSNQQIPQTIPKEYSMYFMRLNLFDIEHTRFKLTNIWYKFKNKSSLLLKLNSNI